MILVIGSTGNLGGEICRLLAERKLPFRAMVRETTDPAKIERLKALGAQIVKGDIRDLHSLKAACLAVDTVITTVSAMPVSYQPGVNDLKTVDTDGIHNVVEAAKSFGVRHIIHTSFSGNINVDCPLVTAKRAAEKMVRESGITYTILRPGYFMEAWLSPMTGFDAPNARATIYGSGDQPIAFISFKDVAHFAVDCLTNPAGHNAVLELGGPEMLSPHQVIRAFEQAAGKAFEVTHVPAEALQAQLDSTPDAFPKSFAGLMLSYAHGDPIDMTALTQHFHIRLTPLAEFIHSVMAPA